MLQMEHSAILSTFIKLPVVIEIFVLSILSGRLAQVFLYLLSKSATCTTSTFSPVSEAEEAGLSLPLSQTPKTRFLARWPKSYYGPS